MNILDLFSGLGGWSAAFKERGHSVTTLDNEPKFKPDLCMDIMDVTSIDGLGKFDVVLASPPCQSFSVAAFPMHYWRTVGNDIFPNHQRAMLGLKLAQHTFWLLEKTYSGKFYVIENPRGLMRKVLSAPAATVCYCQYGSKYMKPTDLWGKLPPSFIPKMCHPRSKDHAAAPRGSKTGIQGVTCNHVYAGGHTDAQFARHGIRKDEKTAANRAIVPYGLSLEMCLACEKDLANTLLE
jgi:hypothetical protein